MSTTMVLQPYGGSTFTLLNVNIDAHSSEVVFAEDNMTPIGSRLSISGTALMSEETWTILRSKIQVNSSRMASVSMTYPSSISKLVDLTAGDSNIGGPFAKISATQVVGSSIALVRFEINDQQSLRQCNSPVVAHTWVQKMSLDAAGRVTRSINGALRIARSSTANDTEPAVFNNWASTSPVADLFRRAILPDVPGEGWRRDAQEFAYDQNSTALLYSITDKQYAYDLPDGVRVGDMDFTFERRAEDAGIGHCSFSCSLEGDLSLKNITGTTGNRRLVEAAVQLSKTRINASYSTCIITRMRVTESNILSGFSIRLEVDADVFSDDGSGAMVPLAFMIGQSFTISRSTSRTLDAYGPLVVVDEVPTAYAMLPHYITNLLNGMTCAGVGDYMPTATLTTITGANSYGSVSVTVTSSSEGTAATNAPFEGAFSASNYQFPVEPNTFSGIIAHQVAITRADYDSGICRLSPMYTDTTDYVFQTRKPSVIITEEAEAARNNNAPGKIFRPLPTGAYLLNDNANVSFGKYDAQGQRLFTGVYQRKYALYDAGGTTTNGFYTQTAPSGAALRAWAPPNETLLPTLSYTGTTASQSTGSDVFANATDAEAQYPVPAEDFVT